MLELKGKSVILGSENGEFGHESHPFRHSGPRGIMLILILFVILIFEIRCSEHFSKNTVKLRMKTIFPLNNGRKIL
jgi:hypothetical protein